MDTNTENEASCHADTLNKRQSASNFRASYYGRESHRKDEKTSVFVDGLYEEPASEHSINTQNFSSATSGHQLPFRSNKGFHPLNFSQSSVLQPNIPREVILSSHSTKNGQVIYGRNTGPHDIQVPSNGHNPNYHKKNSFNDLGTNEHNSFSRTNYLMQYSKALYSVQNDLLTREATLRSKVKMTNHLTQSSQIPTTTTHYYNSHGSQLPFAIGSYDQRTTCRNKLQYERNLGPIDLWYRDLQSCNPMTNSRNTDGTRIYPSQFSSHQQRCLPTSISYQQRPQPEGYNDTLLTFKATQDVKSTTNSMKHTLDTKHSKEKPKEKQYLNDTLTYAQLSAQNMREESGTKIQLDLQGSKTQSNKEENGRRAIVQNKHGNDNIDIHGKYALTGRCYNKNINEEIFIINREIPDENHLSSRTTIVLMEPESSDIVTIDKKDTDGNMKGKCKISRVLSEELRKKQFSPKQRMLEKFRCENEICEETVVDRSGKDGIQLHYIISPKDNKIDQRTSSGLKCNVQFSSTDTTSKVCPDGTNDSLTINQTSCVSSECGIIKNYNIIQDDAGHNCNAEKLQHEKNDGSEKGPSLDCAKTIRQKDFSAKQNTSYIVNNSEHLLESPTTNNCPTDKDVKDNDTAKKDQISKPVITADVLSHRVSGTIPVHTEEEGYVQEKYQNADEVEKNVPDSVNTGHVSKMQDGGEKCIIVNQSLTECGSDTIENASSADISITIAESVSDIFNGSTTSNESVGNVIPHSTPANGRYDAANLSFGCSSENNASSTDLVIHSSIMIDDSSMKHTSESRNDTDEKHRSFTQGLSEEEKRDSQCQDSINTDETGKGKYDSDSIQVMQDNYFEIPQNSQLCTRITNESNNSVCDSHLKTDSFYTSCGSYENLIGNVENETRDELSPNPTNNIDAKNDKCSGEMQETEKANSPKSIYDVQEDCLQTEVVNVGNVIQIGEDSFYDSIETGESSLYHTCLDYEQSCGVEQPIGSDVSYDNELIQCTYETPPVSDLQIRDVTTHSMGSLTAMNSNTLEDLQSINVTTNSIGSSTAIHADTLEDNILQHLNKTIEIVTRTPPQTVDSIDIIQIKKNLECLSQRIESAPLDERSLLYSRNVIWDVLQLCGSCMVLSQVALDRLRSCMGQAVKNQLGFYPDMFIDTLTILFKQASIASSMASNISDDLFFDSSVNNQQSQHVETTDSAKEESCINLTRHMDENLNRTGNNEESQSNMDKHKCDKTDENNHHHTNIQEHNGSLGRNSHSCNENDDPTKHCVKMSPRENENETHKLNYRDEHQRDEGLSLKITNCQTNNKFKFLRTDMLDSKSKLKISDQKTQQSDMPTIFKEDMLSVKKHQEGLDFRKRFKTSKDKWKAKMSSQIGTKITLSNKSIMKQKKYRHEYLSLRRKHKLRQLKKDTIVNNSNSRCSFSNGVLKAKSESSSQTYLKSKNFTNSRSCRRLKQDLFEFGSKNSLHGHNVPSSIVLNYNELSQFCCHVVLTRTPLLHKRSLSRDKKTASSNHRLSKSNSTDKGDSEIQKSQSNQNIGMNRSASDGNINSYFGKSDQDEYFRMQSGSHNEKREQVNQVQSGQEELFANYNIGVVSNSSCCKDSTAVGLPPEIKVDNLAEKQTVTPDIQMNSMKLFKLPDANFVKSHEGEHFVIGNNQLIQDNTESTNEHFEEQQTVESMIIDKDISKGSDKIHNDTECRVSRPTVNQSITSNSVTSNSSDISVVNAVLPENLKEADSIRHAKSSHSASPTKYKEKENVSGNKENFVSRSTATHYNLNKSLKSSTKVIHRDYGKTSFEEEISMLDFSDIKPKSSMKNKASKFSESTSYHTPTHSNETHVNKKQQKTNNNKRDEYENPNVRQAKTHKCRKIKVQNTEHDDGDSPMKLKRLDSDCQFLKKSSEKITSKDHRGCRTGTESKQETKVANAVCWDGINRYKTEQSRLITKQDDQNKLSRSKTTSDNKEGSTKHPSFIEGLVANVHETLPGQVQNAKKDNCTKEINHIRRKIVVDTQHKDSNNHSNTLEESLRPGLDVEHSLGTRKVKRTLSYPGLGQEHCVSPIKKRKSSSDQHTDIVKQSYESLERTNLKFCRNEVNERCKDNNENFVKTLSKREHCNNGKDKRYSNTSNISPDRHINTSNISPDRHIKTGDKSNDSSSGCSNISPDRHIKTGDKSNHSLSGRNTSNISPDRRIKTGDKSNHSLSGRNTSNISPDRHIKTGDKSNHSSPGRSNISPNRYIKTGDKSNHSSSGRSVDEFKSKFDNRINHGSSACCASKDRRQTNTSIQSNNNSSACGIREEKNQIDSSKQSNNGSLSCCVRVDKKTIDITKQSKQGFAVCPLRDDKRNIDNRKQSKHGSSVCCVKEDKSKMKNKQSCALNNTARLKHPIREGKEIKEQSHNIASTCYAIGTISFNRNVNDESMITEKELRNRKKTFKKSAVKDTTKLICDMENRANYIRTFENGTKPMGSKKDVNCCIMNSKAFRNKNMTNQVGVYITKENNKIVDNGTMNSPKNVNSAANEKKFNPTPNAKIYLANNKDCNSIATDKTSSKQHCSKLKIYNGTHDSTKRCSGIVEEHTPLNDETSYKLQALKNNKTASTDLKRTCNNTGDSIADNKLAGNEMETTDITQIENIQTERDTTAKSKMHGKYSPTSKYKVIDKGRTQTLSKECKIALKCVTNDNGFGQVSPKHGETGIESVPVIEMLEEENHSAYVHSNDNSPCIAGTSLRSAYESKDTSVYFENEKDMSLDAKVKCLQSKKSTDMNYEKSKQKFETQKIIIDKQLNDQSFPIDINKRVNENYDINNIIDGGRIDNTSATRNWLKLSDIYNTAPIESSDDNDDQQSEDDIVITNAVYSPLQFDTESGDELPALSLPNKGKHRRNGFKRCHRVDIRTHYEIQKMLKEILPSVPSNNAGPSDSDDDDAKTVTDFSYLSEPQQNFKPKSKKRWNKITFTSNKPQIYSPQEYLSAAGGGIKRHTVPNKDLNKCQSNDKGYPIVSQSIIENDDHQDDKSCTKKKMLHCGSVKTEKEIIPAYRKRGLTCVKECFAVLDKVYNHELSEPFRHEVKSKDVQDYYKIIKRGMCYDMIAHKLRGSIYGKLEEFVDDMKLVFSNCFQYHNDGSETYVAGMEMQAFFEKKMNETFSNIDANFNQGLTPK